MFKKIVLRILITLSLLNLTACTEKPFVEWQEEVNLNDGRIIVVQQKKRQYRGTAAESWLTINLPEISAKPIVWHERLSPLIVNVDAGKLYVVGRFLNGLRDEKECPSGTYVSFEWSNGEWKRMPFDSLPKSIYVVNVLANDFPPKGTELLTLKEKSSDKLNGDLTLPSKYKELDPEHGRKC